MILHTRSTNILGDTRRGVTVLFHVGKVKFSLFVYQTVLGEIMFMKFVSTYL